VVVVAGLGDGCGDAELRPVLPAPVGPKPVTVAAAAPVPALRAGCGVGDAPGVLVPDGRRIVGVPAPVDAPPPPVGADEPAEPASPVVPPLPVVP